MPAWRRGSTDSEVPIGSARRLSSTEEWVMPVVWIDEIYNNSNSVWHLQSVDSTHNGAVLLNGQKVAELDSGDFHDLAPHTHYHAEWCGVPWYWKGEHFKCVRRNTQGIQIFAAEDGGKNWIRFHEAATGRPLARLEVSKNTDTHVFLRFEDDGVFIDVVANANPYFEQFVDSTKDFAAAAAAVVAAILVAV